MFANPTSKCILLSFADHVLRNGNRAPFTYPRLKQKLPAEGLNPETAPLYARSLGLKPTSVDVPMNKRSCSLIFFAVVRPIVV